MQREYLPAVVQVSVSAVLRSAVFLSVEYLPDDSGPPAVLFQHRKLPVAFFHLRS